MWVNQDWEGRIRALQDDHMVPHDIRRTYAHLEVATALHRIADALEGKAQQDVVADPEPTSPENPRMVTAVCDGCGGYSDYYDQNQGALPQGWGTVGTSDYCGVCLRDLESRSHSALLADALEDEDGGD